MTTVLLTGRTNNKPNTYVKLRDCPFCGAPATYWATENGVRIECSNWSVETGQEHCVSIGGITFEEAAEKWNGKRTCSTCVNFEACNNLCGVSGGNLATECGDYQEE